VKHVPVCEHTPSHFLHCERCPVCKLYYKRVVIKREIVVGRLCTTTCEPVTVTFGCSDADESMDDPGGNSNAAQYCPPSNFPAQATSHSAARWAQTGMYRFALRAKAALPTVDR
jgi:hypothetical protein